MWLDSWGKQCWWHLSSTLRHLVTSTYSYLRIYVFPWLWVHVMNKISVSQTWLFPTEMLPDFYNNQSLQRAFRSSLMVGNRMLYTTILSICATSLQAYTKREKFLGRHSLFVNLRGTCFSTIH